MAFILRWMGFSHGLSERPAHGSGGLIVGAPRVAGRQDTPPTSVRRPIRRKDLRPTDGCRPHTLEEFCIVDFSNPALSPSQLSILFFSGKSLNAAITRSSAIFRGGAHAAEFSHVGVVHLWEGGVIGVFESVRARDPLYDALSGIRSKTGVRLVQLRDKIVYYASQGEYEWEDPRTGERVVKVGVLRFNLVCADPTCDMTRVRNMLYEAFCVFQRTESDKTFSQSALEMAQAGAPELFGEGQTNTHEYFCSSLVAKTFVALGALPESYAVSRETPGTLATQTLPLLPGAEFSDELIVAYVSVPRSLWDPSWAFRPAATDAAARAPPPSIYPPSPPSSCAQQPFDQASDISNLPPPIAPTRASELYLQGLAQFPSAARQTSVYPTMDSSGSTPHPP